jgi:hypothetical protein
MWLVVIALVVLVGIPVFLGIRFYICRERAEQALVEAEAEADQSDPGWRLEDIETHRLALPMKDNGAFHVLRAANILPDPWPTFDEAQNVDSAWPQVQLDAATTAALHKHLLPLRRAVVGEAREAMKFKKGWFLVEWSPDYVGTLYKHLGKVRTLAMFLSLDAALRAQDGDVPGAWQSALNLLALSRSLGEEPSLVAQMQRAAFREWAVAALERTLAQCTIHEGDLAAAQQTLATEATEPILLYGLRGERAGMHLLCCNLEACTVDAKTALAITGEGADNEGARAYLSSPDFILQGNTFKRDHAWVLRYCTAMVEAAKGPPWEFEAAVTAWRGANPGPPFGESVAFWVPRLVPRRFFRSQALLDCAAAGIAVERYRLQQGAWPESLEQVVQVGLLARLPTDPFDGKPLRYRKTRDGAVVFSIGPDKNYNGDALDADPETGPPPPRSEFRLWSPEHRRRPTERP